MLDHGFARVLQTDSAKVFTGRTSEGEARATWEILNSMPSRTAQGGEVEQGRQQQQDRAEAQESNGDEQQTIDSMLQKLKAQGQEECEE